MKSYKSKHLRMLIFHKNKDSRSKDQNKNEFHFILTAKKTNVNRFFFHGETKLHFESLVNTL